MDGRITKYLFLAVVIVDLIQAEPRLDFLSEAKSGLNQRLTKALLYKVKQKSRKQDGNEVGEAKIVSLNYEPEVDTENAEEMLLDGQPGDATTINTENVDELPIQQEERPVESLPEHHYGHIDKKFLYRFSRPLQIGDTLTPEELLEITKRLFKKVTKPGKGIVTSAKNEYDLADKLFERFFFTWKRIIIVKGNDIDGLDALQALSLDGDVVNNLRTSLESFTEAPSTLLSGFKTDLNLKLDDDVQKCHYKVIKKWVKDNPSNKKEVTKKRNGRKVAEQLKKKLGKNRVLVVNPGRRESRRELAKKKVVSKKVSGKKDISEMISNYKNAIEKEKSFKEKLLRTRNDKSLEKINNQKLLMNTKQKSDQNVTCRWKYRCTQMLNLHSCRLFPICSNQTGYNISFIEEPNEILRRFRENVGVSVLDENVEKIIEGHFIRMRYMPERKPDKRFENLIEYFNKLMEENGYGTTPIPSQKDQETEAPHFLKEAADEIVSDTRAEADDEEARRILGLLKK